MLIIHSNKFIQNYTLFYYLVKSALFELSEK